MAENELPSQDVLRQLLRYDAQAGKLYWRKRDASWQNSEYFNKNFAGREAFTSLNRGYKYGRALGVLSSAHRVIWKMVYGETPDIIDHVNGDKSDNRLSNLRASTKSDNALNVGGLRGLSWDKRYRKWTALIERHGQRKHLGSFVCFGRAAKARRRAEHKLGIAPIKQSTRLPASSQATQ